MEVGPLTPAGQQILSVNCKYVLNFDDGLMGGWSSIQTSSIVDQRTGRQAARTAADDWTNEQSIKKASKQASKQQEVVCG